MRAIILAIVLIIGCTLTVLAQSQSNIFPHNGFMKYKIGRPVTSFVTDSLNKGKLNIPFSTRNLYFHDLKAKEFKIGRPAEASLMVDQGMQVVKPKGSFPMPIYQPDSTIRFTMRIKEYKRIPPGYFR